MSAKDDDGDAITYSLDDQDGANFEIDSNGQIKTKNELDYETTQSYSVIVSVTDGIGDQGNAETPGSETEDDSIGVTINVTDVNEKPQFADDAPITQEVAENTPAQTNIGTAYTATDPERDTLTYTLDTGDGASFAIGDATGQLETKADLDHETKSSYSVTIRVTDGKAADGSTETNATIDDTHDVTITVTDLDEEGTISFSPETPAAGSPITATLQDDDAPVSIQAWQWHISSDQNTWTPISGADSSSYTSGSDDIGKYLRVTVTYTDSFGDNKTVQAVTDAVLTAPVTNQHPEFASDAAIMHDVAENTPAGVNIGGPYTATHADSKGTVVYSLGGTDASSFDLDTSTGQLKTKSVFDYETDAKLSYMVTVSVTDGLDDHSLSDTVVDGTITVTISVTDVNEPPQFDAATASITIPEDTPVGQNVGDAMVATDEDTSDTVTYSVSGTDADLFQVDSGGQLQVKEALDFEDKSTLTVIINATDSRDDSGTVEQTPVTDDSVTVTVTVTNVFEAPRFDDEIPQGESSITRSVPENTGANQSIGAPIRAIDDEGDTVTYRLDGTDATSFGIDITSGQLKTKEGVDLDHETKASYSVIVRVADGKANDGTPDINPTDDASIDVTINVTDVNEKPAFDANAPAAQTVAENTAAGTAIGSPYTATDPDDGETLTYGLEGTDAASFDIDTSAGQIKTKADLDHEGKETYSVTVTVSDGRDDAGTAEDPPVVDARLDVTITVTDEDDPGKITLSSQQPSSGNEVTATLEDDDEIKSDVDITWLWEKSADKTDPNSWTTIEAATTNSYIPQEEDEGNHLRVTATYEDELGPDKTAQKVSDSEVLEIEATNKLPAFDLDSDAATLTVRENTQAGENIGDPFTATDADDSALTYSLSGTDASSFDIVSTSGQIQTKEVLDYENANSKTTYDVTVQVTDSNDPWGNADAVVDDTIEVTINVTDMIVPAVPGQPAVNATSGAAAGLSVSWTAIDPTDDAPVDGYDVQYRVKDANPPAEWTDTDVTVTGASATITGLAYSTTYEVQVRSKNSEGESDWSDSGEEAPFLSY